MLPTIYNPIFEFEFDFFHLFLKIFALIYLNSNCCFFKFPNFKFKYLYAFQVIWRETHIRQIKILALRKRRFSQIGIPITIIYEIWLYYNYKSIRFLNILMTQIYFWWVNTKISQTHFLNVCPTNSISREALSQSLPPKLTSELLSGADYSTFYKNVRNLEVTISGTVNETDPIPARVYDTLAKVTSALARSFVENTLSLFKWGDWRPL